MELIEKFYKKIDNDSGYDNLSMAQDLAEIAKEHCTKQCNIADFRNSVTITIPLEIAETLHGLVDGCMGSSDDDSFNKEMDIVRKKLDKEIDKHYV